MMNGSARISGRSTLALLAASAFHLPAMAQKTFALSVPASAATSVLLSSPLDYQVFQRETRLKGTISIFGRALVPINRVEARVVGQAITGPLAARWHTLSLNQRTGEFHANLMMPAGGFYEVDVRVQDRAGHVETVAVPHVGVGEVFVVSGQSNSTNYGEVPQVTETGMVATFSGETWRVANDPQPGVQDDSKKGSFIPSLGDALYRRYRVPIGVASVGHGSTSVRQWLPAGEPIEIMPTMTKYVVQAADGTLTSDGKLFNGMMTRIRQLGVHGFRAVLWHQGESDSHQPPEHEITAETYRRMLRQVILATRSKAGWNIPWFVAQATYHTP
jgi:hypothetical protein